MSTVTMDGVIAYALAKKMSSSGGGGNLNDVVRDVEYRNDSKTLVVTKKDASVSNLDLSGLAGVNLKREKLTVTQDGQTEFTTTLDATPTDLASIYYYLLINGQEYIDNATLRSVNNKVVVVWDNIFNLEITDSVYMYYFLLPTISGDLGGVTSVNGQTGAVILNAGDVDAYTKAEVNALIGAGSGGVPAEYLKSATYEQQTRTLKLTKQDNTEVVVAMNDLATKQEVNTELNKKVNSTDYDAYKLSNDTKVNASIKKIAFVEASKELTITKTDDSEEKVNLSSLSGGVGGGNLGLTTREW